MLESIRLILEDPRQLEELYQSACKEEKEAEFAAGLMALQAEYPDNVLLKAWYYRLLAPGTLSVHAKAVPEAEARPTSRPVNWGLLLILGLLNMGIMYFLLGHNILAENRGQPAFIVFWAPVLAVFTIVYLTRTARRNFLTSGLMCAGIGAAAIYVELILLGQKPGFQDNYLQLMALHLPLLAWVAVGISVAGLRSTPIRRFAIMGRSLNVFVTVGVYGIILGIFTGITAGLFSALNIVIPDWFVNLAVAVGAGFIPLIALTSVYDPHLEPEDQDTQRGLGKVIASLMLWILPLALLVLVVYLAFIPANFMRPFQEREVLIIYNILLFAIIGLLIGVGPVREEDLSPRVARLLRWGILALGILVVVISLYALSATVYRTVLGGPTMNRITVIGWNIINIAILALASYRIIRWGKERWIAALHSAFSVGVVAYLAWGLVIVITVPWLFK
jgi:hypothetical protein